MKIKVLKFLLHFVKIFYKLCLLKIMIKRLFSFSKNVYYQCSEIRLQKSGLHLKVYIENTLEIFHMHDAYVYNKIIEIYSHS